MENQIGVKFLHPRHRQMNRFDGGDWDALRAGFKMLAAALFALIVIWWVALVTGCGQKATFTPATVAPADTSDAKVLERAAKWAADDPSLFYATTADTRSMEPFFDRHSVPLCVRYTGQPVSNGAVAIFNRGDNPRVMHVISDQTATHVYMSGYNNHQSDGWFPKTAVEGIVVGQLYRP